MARKRSDCLVSGALALTLLASRFVCVAPLRVTRDEGRWRISVSKAFSFYSYLVLFGSHIVVLTGLAIDFSLEHSVRLRTPTSRATWISELAVALAISTVGVLGSPWRMKKMIECLNVIEKVHIQSKNKRAYKCGEKKIFIAAVVYLFAVSMHIFTAMYVFYNRAIRHGKNMKVAWLYSVYNLEVLMNYLLEMQFIFLALQVNSCLTSVNDSLDDLKYIIDLQTIPSLSTLLLSGRKDERMEPATVAGIQIGDLISGDKLKRTGPNTIKAAEEKIRRHLLAFGAICDVIRQINLSYGNVLLLLFIGFFLHLVVAPYYLISDLFNPNEGAGRLLLHILYCTLHASYMVIAVEPGHRTEREMERTSMLVSQLLRRVSSPRDGLASELDLFYKQIALNQVAYCPLGMCILTRPLIAAICGGVTTYLVIILQFQALGKQSA